MLCNLKQAYSTPNSALFGFVSTYQNCEVDIYFKRDLSSIKIQKDRKIISIISTFSTEFLFKKEISPNRGKISKEATLVPFWAFGFS